MGDNVSTDDGLRAMFRSGNDARCCAPPRPRSPGPGRAETRQARSNAGELFADSRERLLRNGYQVFLLAGCCLRHLATAGCDAARAAQMRGFTERTFASLAQVARP